MFGNNEQILLLSMSAQEVIDALTLDNVVAFLKSLGVEEMHVQSKKGIIICPTICHNPINTDASMKLYWYQEKKHFRCYTECQEWMNIFELYQKFMALNYHPVDWYEAEDYVKQFINPTNQHHTRHSQDTFDIDDFRCDSIAPEYTPYPETVLTCFSKYYHPAWLHDGISKEAMDKFGILFSYGQNKIIIPHRDKHGQLIGIRGRAFEEADILAGKYKPVMVGNTIYSHQLMYNLYGLYEHQEAIKKLHTVVIAEGEKSVLLDETYHPGHGICVACCGHKISKYHIYTLVYEYNVQEIVIAYDKDDPIDSEKGKELKQSIIKLGQTYKHCVNISYIWDYNNKLDLKDSPYDKGKATFEYLYRTRIKIR